MHVSVVPCYLFHECKIVAAVWMNEHIFIICINNLYWVVLKKIVIVFALTLCCDVWWNILPLYKYSLEWPYMTTLTWSCFPSKHIISMICSHMLIFRLSVYIKVSAFLEVPCSVMCRTLNIHYFSSPNWKIYSCSFL